MSKKCKFCFIKSEDTLEICPACKIAFRKTKNELTEEEKKVWHAARNLRLLGLFVIGGGMLGVLMTVSIESDPIAGVIGLTLFTFGIFLGMSLRKYRKWCHMACTVLFAVGVYSATIRLNAFNVIFPILFMYAIAAPTCRKLLLRKP